jgi:hypothetical protein
LSVLDRQGGRAATMARRSACVRPAVFFTLRAAKRATPWPCAVRIARARAWCGAALIVRQQVPTADQRHARRVRT